MITGDGSYCNSRKACVNISKEVLMSRLQKVDIDDIGARHYVDNKELRLKDAVLKMDRQLFSLIIVFVAFGINFFIILLSVY